MYMYVQISGLITPHPPSADISGLTEQLPPVTERIKFEKPFQQQRSPGSLLSDRQRLHTVRSKFVIGKRNRLLQYHLVLQ